MKKVKTKICIGCHSLFQGRRDAKTCSARCRKRYQRAKETYLATEPESHLNRGNLSHINSSTKELAYIDH
jgi:hypothetical protein